MHCCPDGKFSADGASSAGGTRPGARVFPKSATDFMVRLPRAMRNSVIIAETFSGIESLS
jgi:hypothetical protein